MTQLDLAMKQLCAQASFRLFLLHVARTAGIFTPTAGAGETLQFREGQRSLGLEILRLAARGLPRTSTEQMIALVLASEANPKETEDAEEPSHDRD